MSNRTQFNIRVTQEQKEALERAAEKNNVTITKFLIDSAMARAKELKLIDQEYWESTIQRYNAWVQFNTLQEFRTEPGVLEKMKELREKF